MLPLPESNSYHLSKETPLGNPRHSLSLFLYTSSLLALKFLGAGTMIYTSSDYCKICINFHNTVETEVNVLLAFLFLKSKHF